MESSDQVLELPYDNTCQVLYIGIHLIMHVFFYAAKIYNRVPTEKQRNLIAELVKHKWRLIGIHLGVDQAELEQITHDCHGDDSRCSSELFRKWAAEEVSKSCPFTWKGLIEALDNDVVKESSLARDLESIIL